MAVQKILSQQIANTGGTAGQVLVANSTGVTWGDANNAINLGGVAAASYQTTAGLSANVATLTANNTAYVGTVSAANVVSNAQLISNLANYQTTAGLSANVATLSANNASYLGTVAAASYVNTSGAYTISGVHTYTANIVIGTTAGISANSSYGTAGQVLTSNGTTAYWSTASSGGFTNGQSISVSNFAITGVASANGSNGTAGYYLTSSGTSNTYWSAPPTAVRQQFTGDGTTTSFTVTGGYTANAISVFVNGVLLRNGIEVTVTSGTNVVFAIAPLSGAFIDAIGSLTPGASSSSGGGLSLASVQTANVTASAGYIYPINTSSGPVYVTLPASPTAGQQIAITDYAGTFTGNNCILNPNGGKISGSAANTVLSTSREGAAIVYVDSTQGWLGYGNFIVNPVGPFNISYTMVGGGGGATGGISGVNFGAGGAGGVLRTATVTVSTGSVYTITVGSGGAGVASGTSANGGISSIVGSGVSVTATGGNGANSSQTVGASNADYAGGAGSGSYGAGGGAGAGGTGGASNAGGPGASTVISGTTTYYGGGGGGAGGAGGSGGGGGSGINGTTNTGGGAGGGSSGQSMTGGSGIVILSIPTANYSGVKTGLPTVTTSGAYTILTFTASGSYTA